MPDCFTASLLAQFMACQPATDLPEIKELPPLPPEQIRQELPVPTSDHQCEAI